MSNKAKSRLFCVLGFVFIGVGLGLIYPPLAYIYVGVLCKLVGIAYDKDE